MCCAHVYHQALWFVYNITRYCCVMLAAPEDEAKSELLQVITDYINEKILMADKVLVDYAVTKVYDDDVILTYAYSHVVLEVLLTAHNKGKRFRVVVVDSRPELEGRQLLRRLLQVCMWFLDMHGGHLGS